MQQVYLSVPKAGTVSSAVPELTFADAPVSPSPIQAQSEIAMVSAVDEIKYAGFWVRYVANVIDGLVLVIPAIIIDLGLFFLLGNNVTFKILSYVLYYLIIWSYFVVMTYKYQATLGKMAVGVKVVSDKSERLTVGQLILRETLGKFISLITIYIGYIMAGFTERKQALHDKIAKTVVVYKDPNHKVAWWAVALALILPGIAIVGILASIVLVSLSSARMKASDASVKSSMMSLAPDMIIYQADHGSYSGYEPSADFNLIACSGQPIINISPDGKNIAAFAKLCSDQTKYFCADPETSAEVDAQYAQSGASSCENNSNVQSNQQSTSFQATDSSQGIPNSSSVTSNTKSNLNNHDMAISMAFTLVNDDIAPYQEMNKTYGGFKENLSKYDINTPDCHSTMKLDIKPDGTTFVLHQPLCSDPSKSFCLENTDNQVKIVDNYVIEKTFHCQ